MPRIRTIKPEFFSHEILASKSAHARLLAIGLLTIADREGRLRWVPMQVHAQVFPWEAPGEAFESIEVLLGELIECDYVTHYEVEGKRYIEINNFCKHQRISGKEAAYPSKIPPPPSKTSKNPEESGEASGCFPEKRRGASPRSGGVPLGTEEQRNRGTEEQGNRREGEGAVAPAPSRGTPPTLEEVSEYVQEAGLSQVDPAAFVDHYQANGWKQSNGQAIKDWQAACRGWNRRQSQFTARTQPRAGPLKGEALVAENRETIKRYAERVKNGTVGDLFGGVGHAGGGPGPADQRAAVGSVSGRIVGPVG